MEVWRGKIICRICMTLPCASSSFLAPPPPAFSSPPSKKRRDLSKMLYHACTAAYYYLILRRYWLYICSVHLKGSYENIIYLSWFTILLSKAPQNGIKSMEPNSTTNALNIIQTVLRLIFCRIFVWNCIVICCKYYCLEVFDGEVSCRLLQCLKAFKDK